MDVEEAAPSGSATAQAPARLRMEGTGHPGPLGCLDEPHEDARVERGAFTVSGWAIFPSAPTSRIEVWLGERSLGLAQVGLARPDVRAVHDLPGASVAGFSLRVDLGAWPDVEGEERVRAVVTSVRGEELELATTVAVVPPPPRSNRGRPAVGQVVDRRGKGPRTLVCTHQLCLGGASRYLLETLEELLRLEAIDPVVLSPIGGPSRPLLEALGVPVHVSGPAPLDDVVAHDGRVEEILAWAAPQEFELVLVNTASPLTAAGAEVAKRLGTPAIWVIHESFPPPVLWDSCSPEVRGRVEEALRAADLALFVAAATARIFEPYLPGRCRTLPYGIDLGAIDAVRASFDRDGTRQRLGVPADADLLLCVGRIEPRKAQVVLAQAFDLIAHHHPNARLALAGGEDTPDSHALAGWIASSGSAKRIELIPTTPEIQQWYGVADVLVCASRIESLPRGVVEGMAWELPVLATEIFGIPELVEDGATGWLCEDGDTVALAVALERALASDPAERRRMGQAGRRLVERRHDLGAYGRELARELGRLTR